jgi:hypothetical protein
VWPVHAYWRNFPWLSVNGSLQVAYQVLWAAYFLICCVSPRSADQLSKHCLVCTTENFVWFAWRERNERLLHLHGTCSTYRTCLINIWTWTSTEPSQTDTVNWENLFLGSLNRYERYRMCVRKFEFWIRHILYRVIHKSLRDFRPLRYSSRDCHAEGEHVNRGGDTPSFCPTLLVLDMSTLGDVTDVNPVIKFLLHTWNVCGRNLITGLTSVITPNVVRRCVWSRNLMNEEPYPISCDWA